MQRASGRKNRQGERDRRLRSISAGSKARLSAGVAGAGSYIAAGLGRQSLPYTAVQRVRGLVGELAGGAVR